MEVGFGVGSNWEYLPADVDYTGIEPDEYMLERAIQNAHAEGLELELEAHDVQSLPYEDDSFDTVITTLIFCSVPDAHTGLAEINRVLKPVGELRFAEHVRSQ
ncbi:MAG TPA: class I SAM-dependent methyltransferase, partial [Dehalococcoidia bacterium]|nr:class I SAM-dependent methyltransferase [Dehalococcoidia bacterium]